MGEIFTDFSFFSRYISRLWTLSLLEPDGAGSESGTIFVYKKLKQKSKSTNTQQKKSTSGILCKKIYLKILKYK